MADRLYRTQILLAPEQHKALAEIAHKEGRSISDVARQTIGLGLKQLKQSEEADLQKKLDALERIRENKNKILKRRGGKPIDIDVVELINQMREERDAHILAVIANAGNDDPSN